MTEPDDDILDTSYLRPCVQFDHQVQELLQRVRLSRAQVEGLTRLFSDLESTLRGRWPECQVYAFGSIVTGLGIQTSDVDCYVFLPPHVMARYDKKDSLVSIAKSVLATKHTVFTDLFAIRFAKVPIVKFFHIPTQRHCDVNFKSPSGVENTKLISFFLSRDQRALDLTVIIKYWSKVHTLTGTNLLPNYALTMLVIFYLQQRHILPSVHELQRSIEPYMIDKWNTAFDDEYNIAPSGCESLYELLGGFFNYYHQFDFKNLIVSPFVGQPVHKQLFETPDTVPEQFELYKMYGSRKESHLVLKLDTCMCVQDPFEHYRNCAGAVYPKLAEKFRAFLEHAARMFNTAPKDNFLKEILKRQPALESIVAPKIVNRPNRVQKRNKKKAKNMFFKPFHLINRQKK